eukprot:TRINITY_DN7764_c0_g1_i23.p2 TRINITY_DN7764_c0_g1~~TRINITY_DN7764_c0_g1_i23.p2  ORF type:complete len:295 (-),score=82.83 TRINITY_DN7764_c0_g1_i23:18-902(-)
MLKLLVSHKADIETPTANGNTPIMWASFAGNAKVVEYLLSKGVAIANCNNEGHNALDLAISRMYYTCALPLYAAGSKLRPIEEYESILRFPYDLPKFLDYLSEQKAVEDTSIFYAKQNEGVDLVVDTRETWREFFARVWNFGHVPLVERTELPENKQPHRSVYGKLACYLNGIDPYPPPKPPGQVLVNMDSANAEAANYQVVPGKASEKKEQEDEKEEEINLEEIRPEVCKTEESHNVGDEKSEHKDRVDATELSLKCTNCIQYHRFKSINSIHNRGFGAVSYTHLTLPTNREV